MSNLHPIFEQALKPWIPPKETDEQVREAIREKLLDEYRTGLDAPPDTEEDDE